MRHIAVKQMLYKMNYLLVGVDLIMSAYKDFTNRLKLLFSKNPDLIITTLSNIFTMRLIGNKTHGDLAEIAISEFINQYMYDFKSLHVGKDLYRAKSNEEDIYVTNEITNEAIPISLKASNFYLLIAVTARHHRLSSLLVLLHLLSRW